MPCCAGRAVLTDTKEGLVSEVHSFLHSKQVLSAVREAHRLERVASALRTGVTHERGQCVGETLALPAATASLRGFSKHTKKGQAPVGGDEDVAVMGQPHALR